MKNWLSKRVALKAVKGQAWAPRWWAVFLIGLALWCAAVGSVFVTGDIIVLPTVFLLGSFLVPVLWSGTSTTIRARCSHRRGS